MTEASFQFLREFLKARSGLNLAADKRYLVESRLAPLARSFAFASLDALVALLHADATPGLAQSVLDAMATHETSFFRDGVPFESFRTIVLPRLLAARRETRRLRVWSAAASTGQEAYSLAMILAGVEPALTDWHVEIVATDMSAAALEKGQAGTYSQFEVQRGLPIKSLLRHFTQVGEEWTVDADLRAAIQWRVANLLGDLRWLGRFDVVFCRNILIYLDQAAKAELLAKISDALAPDGALCLGSTEFMAGCPFAPDAQAPGFHQPIRSVPIPGAPNPAIERLQAVG